MPQTAEQSRPGEARRSASQRGSGRGQPRGCGRGLPAREEGAAVGVSQVGGRGACPGRANGVSGGAGCGRYGCSRRGPRDGRSPGRWCWWPPPLPEPEPEPPPLQLFVVASQGGGMLGKGGVGGSGGTKAPKPSFVSYVRPEVRERPASAAAGGAAGPGALPARVPGGAKRRDALGPPGGPRPGPLRRARQVLGQGPSLAATPMGGSRSREVLRLRCPRYPGRAQKACAVRTPRGSPGSAQPGGYALLWTYSVSLESLSAAFSAF